jgi:hypothetical protein
MILRILLIADLLLCSMVLWPPGASLLSYRSSSPDSLLRMALSIWIGVGAILLGQLYLLRGLRGRSGRRSEETADAETDVQPASDPAGRRSVERRGADRRARGDGPPRGMPERRRIERRGAGFRLADTGDREDSSLQHSR